MSIIFESAIATYSLSWELRRFESVEIIELVEWNNQPGIALLKLLGRSYDGVSLPQGTDRNLTIGFDIGRQ